MLIWLGLTYLLLSICYGRVLESSNPKLESNNIVKYDTNAASKGKRPLKPNLNIRNGPAEVMEITAGDGKFIECEAGGTPLPTIHWLKDGKMITQSLYEAMHGEEDEMVPYQLGIGLTRSRLYIDCATSRDAGRYTCIAENKYFRKSRTGEVIVIDSLDGERNAICLAKKAFGTPAKVNLWTHTRLENMGMDVQLVCRGGGDPQPQVIWTGPDKRPLTDPRKYQLLENGDLIIREIEWSDMGGYMCHVTNSEGSDEALVFLYPVLPEKKSVTKE
ncbi:Neural/ectodermal development factor IMP-L2, partial [Stegodyphus mimosarum]